VTKAVVDDFSSVTRRSHVIEQATKHATKKVKGRVHAPFYFSPFLPYLMCCRRALIAAYQAM